MTGLHVVWGHRLMQQHSLQIQPHFPRQRFVLLLCQIEMSEVARLVLVVLVPAPFLVRDVIEAHVFVAVAMAFLGHFGHSWFVGLEGFEKFRNGFPVVAWRFRNKTNKGNVLTLDQCTSPFGFSGRSGGRGPVPFGGLPLLPSLEEKLSLSAVERRIGRHWFEKERFSLLERSFIEWLVPQLPLGEVANELIPPSLAMLMEELRGGSHHWTQQWNLLTRAHPGLTMELSLGHC